MLNIPMPVPQLPENAQIKRASTRNLSFSIRALRPDREIELVPWHRISHERYTLYWNVNARRDV
jgi:hypothetical protein